jgi:hypothetical protein
MARKLGNARGFIEKRSFSMGIVKMESMELSIGSIDKREKCTLREILCEGRFYFSLAVPSRR